MGMILGSFTDIERTNVLKWFCDAVSLSKQYNQTGHYEYLRETCRQLEILDEVEQRIAQVIQSNKG